jgi:hypothetical protein
MKLMLYKMYMFNYLKGYGIILLLFLLLTGTIYGQEFTKHSVKTGIGVGASMECNSDGMGFVYSLGYQREIWKDRLRLNPNFSIGHYSSKFIMDARDQYFNSINIETNLYFDIIKIKAFSLVVGTGGLLNNMRGLKGTGGDPDGYTGTPHSEYINDWHWGGYLGGGFRINHPDKRTAINIMPLNLHFGNEYFGEFHFLVQLDFKF